MHGKQAGPEHSQRKGIGETEEMAIRQKWRKKSMAENDSQKAPGDNV